MKTSTIVTALAGATGMLFAASIPLVGGQELPATAGTQARRDRFRHNGAIESEDASPAGKAIDRMRGPAEVPTGFDNLTNGFSPQGPRFDTIDEDTVVADRSFNDNRFLFEEVETTADGLGPTYNAQSPVMPAGCDARTISRVPACSSPRARWRAAPGDRG